MRYVRITGLLSRKQLQLVILGIVIVGIIGYAGTGIVYAGALVSSAERTLNTVVSHQNSLNTSFNEINGEVAALNGSSSSSVQQAVSLADRSVAHSQLATQTINQDDASLKSTEEQLAASRWLTAVGHSSLDRESGRIGHARNALGAARTIAADGVLDGRFWHSLYSALVDLDLMKNQGDSGDFTSAKNTLATMKSDTDQAAQQSTSPGLPSELHSLLLDLQTFVADYGKQLDAQLANDEAGVAADQANLDSDRNKLATYDIDKIGTEINAFFAPLVERYNLEIAAATAG